MIAKNRNYFCNDVAKLLKLNPVKGCRKKKKLKKIPKGVSCMYLGYC